MFSNNRLLRGAATIAAVVVVIAGLVFINNNTAEVGPDVLGGSKDNSVPNPQIAVGGWLPYWDDGSALNTFKTNSKTISEIHPFEYQVNSATDIQLQGNKSHHDLVASAIKKAKTATIPTLTEKLNTADFTTLLNDPAQVAAHAQAVCRWVTDNDYDGVDIDYEEFVLNLSVADAPLLAPKYTALMSSMADCLHQHKKKLEVTVLPRTLDPRYDYFERHLSVPVFDYAALGKVADYINPMAYDFTYSGSPPGSTDPIEWVKAVVKFTTDRVPASKVNLSIPLYGWNWVNKGTSSTAANSVNLANKYHTVPTRDPATQSLVFTFAGDDGNNHTVWYDDAQATALRVQLARDKGLHGVLFWTLGDEVPGTWDAIITPPAASSS